MRLLVLIPDAAARQRAGVRLRHARLAPELDGLGHRLEIRPLGEIGEAPPDADLCVFAKTGEAETLRLARRYRAAGLRVGLDLVDDYFSQSGDARLAPYRRWLGDIAPHLDLVLCASPAIAARLGQFAPGVRRHVLRDPAPVLDPERTAAGIVRKAARARAEKRLCFGWFGMGDNPHFPLGLSDIHAFQDALTPARRQGYAVRLTVLTNPRAMTVAALERMARLPFSTALETWTPAREAALLAESLACFLPVGGQPFSTAKSLNRGLTALAGGAQILSAGFPLYDRLGAFVYRDIGGLIADLEAGRLRLSPATLPDLARLLPEVGDAATEAQGLIRVLETLPPARSPAG